MGEKNLPLHHGWLLSWVYILMGQTSSKAGIKRGKLTASCFEDSSRASQSKFCICYMYQSAFAA